MNYITNSQFNAADYFPAKTLRNLFILVLCFFNLFDSNSQTLPAGFVQEQVTNDIFAPTTMAFAPDGRIFVAQQNGKLRIVKNGNLLSQPFISLNVDSTGERGLLGIAFDPYFTSNHYIYLYYTLASGAHNRVSRFTANGDNVVAGSEHVILNLDSLSTQTNHNGGNLQFGHDGKLYIAVGNNANYNAAQDLNTNLGKILRINKNGTIPATNPFKNGNFQKRSVWSYGMRNPFTLAVHPVSNKIYANDVGESSWEEINNISTGGHNYGWPTFEGYSNQPGLRSPVYAYAHGTGNSEGCAITGGTFFKPASTSFPSKYIGNYFFVDLCNNWINRLIFNGTTITHAVFGTSIPGSPLGITTGPDGNLYFLLFNNNSLCRIIYTGTSAPEIAEQTISKSEGEGATSINDFDQTDLVKINPNPAGNYFTVGIPEDMNECVLRIINSEGRQVKELNIKGRMQISTDDLKNGLYIISVENNSAVIRKRLIIQK